MNLSRTLATITLFLLLLALVCSYVAFGCYFNDYTHYKLSASLVTLGMDSCNYLYTVDQNDWGALAAARKGIMDQAIIDAFSDSGYDIYLIAGGFKMCRVEGVPF